MEFVSFLLSCVLFFCMGLCLRLEVCVSLHVLGCMMILQISFVCFVLCSVQLMRTQSLSFWRVISATDSRAETIPVKQPSSMQYNDIYSHIISIISYIYIHIMSHPIKTLGVCRCTQQAVNAIAGTAEVILDPAAYPSRPKQTD